MIAYGQYAIRIGKGVSTGELLDSVLEALGPRAQASCALRFFLQDLPGHPGYTRRPASRTLLRAHPELDVYLPSSTERGILSTLDQSWAVGHPGLREEDLPPVGVELLREIAHGIPGRFPFQFAHFLVDGVPALGPAPTARSGTAAGGGLERIGGYPAPHLHLSSEWSAPRRRIALVATARLEGGTGGVPTEEAVALLSRLGEYEPRGEIYRFSLDERARLDRARAEADSLVQAFRTSLEDWAAGLELPHDLTADAPRASTSRGRVTRRVLEGQGWTYLPERSGRGVYELRRTGSRNHVLSLYMDLNDWHASAIAFLSLAGPGWHYSSELPFTPTAFEVVAGDTERWEALLANLAQAARLMERDLYEPVSRLFPPAPEGWTG